MSLDRLRFAGVSRRFGRLTVLRGAAGEVESGGVLLVTGRNGCGKSTLLRCLAGLVAPQAGTIEMLEDGRPLAAAERRRRVGLVAPDLAFYEPLSVAENVAFFCRLRRVDPERGAELLARVGLPPERLAGALSSGMLQRLRWVWALLHRPRLLLLDEPFQNLDAAGEAAVRELLAEHLEAPPPGRPGTAGLAVVASPSPLEVPRVATHLDLGG